MVRKNRQNITDLISRLYIGVLLLVFGGIVLHAPISVAFSVLWPEYSLLIKSWKEVLMLIAGLMALFVIYKNKEFKILKDPIILAIAAYGFLHLVMLFYKPQGIASATAGLAIDLRFVLYFGLVYIALRLYPEYKKIFIKVALIGAVVVSIFSLLQVFVLPHDVLKYIGYSNDTITPYLTVDQNYDYIRINSTFRGPNPLGAYAVIVLSLAAVAAIKRKFQKYKYKRLILGILLLGGAVELWASYSRSALVAAFIAVSIIAAGLLSKKLSLKAWGIVASSFLIVVMGSLWLLRDTGFVANVILHDNPTTGSQATSNQGHASSISDGVSQLSKQPLGAGVGSTGSASIFGDNAEIIENQYLFVAHEVGWLGLALFTYIYGLVLFRLWKARSDWLSLATFASGVGIAFICLLLPILADDTVSIVWWGLAAVVLSVSPRVYNKRHER